MSAPKRARHPQRGVAAACPTYAACPPAPAVPCGEFGGQPQAHPEGRGCSGGRWVQAGSRCRAGPQHGQAPRCKGQDGAAVTCGGAGAASCAGAELGPEQAAKEGTESPRCRGAAAGAGAVSPGLGMQVPSCPVPRPLAVLVAPTEPCWDICPRDPCPFPFPQQDGTAVTGTERGSGACEGQGKGGTSSSTALGPAGTLRRAGISQGKMSGEQEKGGLRDYRCERQKACWSLESICSPLGRGKRGPFPAAPNLPRKEEVGTWSTTSGSSPQHWGARGLGDRAQRGTPGVGGMSRPQFLEPPFPTRTAHPFRSASCLRPAPYQQPTAAHAPRLGIAPL